MILNEAKKKSIPVNQQSASEVCQILKLMGAGDDCYVISTDSELDGRELPLQNALEEIVGCGFGSYVSCVAGRLGYYESEEARERLSLKPDIFQPSPAIPFS